MRGGSTKGFTIIEVLLVLAISGALFVSAVMLISGRQNQTAFQESIRQVQSQIQQIVNEVSTGYYPNNGDFKCTRLSGSQPPQLAPLTSGSAEQGTNSGCIFVGKALQFQVGSTADPEQFAVYTIAGLRRGASGGDSTSLADALPVLVAPGSSAAADYPDNSVDERLQNGLRVNSMWYRDGGAGSDQPIGAIAFVNSFTGSAELVSGSGHVDIIAADNAGGLTGLGRSKPQMVDALNSGNGNGKRLLTGTMNPSGGIFICFESGTTQDYAILQIGGASRDFSMALHIIDKEGDTCAYPPTSA